MGQNPTPAKVADIDLAFTCRRSLAAPSGVERWVVRAVLAGPGSGDVERQSGAPAAGEDPVGRIDVLSVDLTRCRDPWAELDASNDAVAHIGETVFDPNTGQLAEGFDSRLCRVGDRVLVVDYVELEPTWQRQHLAALLVAESLDQLRVGCRVMVCLPGPLEHRDLGGAEHEEALRRLQAVWAQVGFAPYDDGVWFLDPHPRTLQESLVRLRGLHGVP
jgi:hypothetical protein